LCYIYIFDEETHLEGADLEMNDGSVTGGKKRKSLRKNKKTKKRNLSHKKHKKK